MDNFIYQQPNEEDFDYRLRLWRSRELWDYLQIEWEEDFMPNEMTQKILAFKQQLYKMTEEEIDAEDQYYRNYLKTTELPHEIAWCHIYFKHLADRKNEMLMEKAMEEMMM
jgi:hypothetical protein